ncbi:hypothetical protein B7463_g3973, partial [Scytalidium lignicola]
MGSLAEKVKATLKNRKESLEQSALFKELPKGLSHNVQSVPKSSGLLTDYEFQLTEEYDIAALLELIKTRQLKSQDLILAYRKRATIAQQLLNCVTELIPDAMDWAKRCDDHLEKTGELLGPLHGIPVSLKEHISIAGRHTTAACVAWVDNIPSEDAQLVKVLRKLGAVPFARTNEPQLLMQLESDNQIWGPARNPWNTECTSGGSSGGEGALMGFNGSVLGIGGDIGGSVRNPAACCGLWGLKPSLGRISVLDVVLSPFGNEGFRGTLGPFTRSFRDILLFCEAYASAKPWLEDASMIPYPISISESSLRTAVSPSCPLRVGILSDDGVLSPLPPVRVILADVRRKLESSPLIKVADFKPFDHSRAWTITAANFWEDKGVSVQALIAEGGEPFLPLSVWLLSESIAAHERLSTEVGGEAPWRTAREAYRREYNDYWNAANIDVVLAPVNPSVAPKLGTSRSWAYTSIWNLLDYPAIAFPASRMLGGYGEDLSKQAYEPRTEIEKLWFENYDPIKAQDMPTGLQVVARRLHDNDMLAAMEIVNKVLTK